MYVRCLYMHLTGYLHFPTSVPIEHDKIDDLPETVKYKNDKHLLNKTNEYDKIISLNFSEKFFSILVTWKFCYILIKSRKLNSN